MKPRKKNAGSQIVKLPVWKKEQVDKALPYITSVMTSVRESYLTMLRTKRRLTVLEHKQGIANREELIEMEELGKDFARHEQNLADTVEETITLNIHCTDPVNGVAMLPFTTADQLAWYVYDLFADEKIQGWRFHHDSLTTRRPLAELDDAKPPTQVIV